MKKFDEKLGYALKSTRKAKKIYQPEIAKKLHVSKMTISHWENGQRSMTAENLLRYCQALNVPVEYILEQTD